MAGSQISDRMADAYEVFDRRIDGYRGKWRYRAKARWGGGRTESLALFRSRAYAAGFVSRCAAFGEAFAYSVFADRMWRGSLIHGRILSDGTGRDPSPTGSEAPGGTND